MPETKPPPAAEDAGLPVPPSPGRVPPPHLPPAPEPAQEPADKTPPRDGGDDARGN